MDLDAASRAALQFDELLEWIASYARTVVGRRRIASLAPSADAETVRLRLGLLHEVRRHLEETGRLVPEKTPDPVPALEMLAVEGVRLDGKVARELALVLGAATSLGRRLRRLSTGNHPQLREMGGGVPDLTAEADAVLRGTDGDGRLLDDASPQLARIRRRTSRVAERLRQMLQRHLREPGAAPVIRDDFVTQRNGRFVIPVRTDAPRAVRGIVHGSSSSGATHFVEPLESVEPNNELVRLFEEEREEQQRILAAWSDAFRARTDDLTRAVESLGRADAWQARALFGEACSGVVPRVGAGGRLRLVDLRHPLLQRRLTAEGGSCVPSTLELNPADQVLVLSGPNTGGKTVALKAMGLAVLMAQSGIPVPATLVELPLYRQVRADIGDHQSIQADLSTYSAHVRAISDAIRERRPPVLFLFDELGTGTEPTEGAALARAILETLVGPGLTAVATTHLASVKAWAVTSDGACCAALDFDPETFSPTYRIVMGAAGRSAGLDIAERLGIPPEIVMRARALLDPQVREGEDYLRRLRDTLAEAEAGTAELRRERRDFEEKQRGWLTRRGEEDAARGREAERRLGRALDDFRRAARRELAALTEPEARARAERRRNRAERRLTAERSRQQSEIVGQGAATPAPGAPVDRESLAPGTRVWVRSVGRVGLVEELRGRMAEVRLGRVLFRVDVDDLHEPPAGTQTEQDRPEGPRTEVRAPIGSACPHELMLVGRRVDAALDELDRYLDAAQLAGHDEVRVVHGHGTGRLRSAVRSHLASHDQVRSHRPGRGAEGGDGVTVVRLD